MNRQLPEELAHLEFLHMTPRALPAFRAGAPLDLTRDDLRSLKSAAGWAVVLCGDRLHVVLVSRRGRVGLLHHGRDEVRRWGDFAELGGARPDCFKWLRILASHRLEGMLRELMATSFKELAYKACMARMARAMRREHWPTVTEGQSREDLST